MYTFSNPQPTQRWRMLTVEFTYTVFILPTLRHILLKYINIHTVFTILGTFTQNIMYNLLIAG